MPAWKRAVARAFDEAQDYDAAALTQAVVAARLAQTIACQPLPPAPRILEVGCGTGLLTRHLRAACPEGTLVATDIAPAMAARCRRRMHGDAALHVLVMDAERPCLRPGFDLVASSLAAQWFEDLPGTLGNLAGLLAPGGLLALTTLAAGTFREWAVAHEGSGSLPATPSYPTAEALRALKFAGCSVSVSVQPVAERHADGRAFLHSLKAIGAGTQGNDGALSPGALRRVLRRFDRAGAEVTYEVATLLIRSA